MIVAVAAALTLLPALLALLGDRIERGRVFRRGRAHPAGPGTVWSRLADANWYFPRWLSWLPGLSAGARAEPPARPAARPVPAGPRA